MRMKKRIAAVLALCLVLSCLSAMPVLAAEASGTCGDHATWTLDSNGVLTIEGTGDMYNYGEFGDAAVAPWSAYAARIKELVIADTITYIGAEAFKGCTALTTFDVPAGVTGIGYRAFAGCTALSRVTVGSDCAWSMVGQGAFADCTSLTELYLAYAQMIEKVSKSWYDYSGILEYVERIYTISSAEAVSDVIRKSFACTNAPQTVAVDGIAYNLYTRGAHDYQESVKEPTCTEAGLKQFRCKACGFGYEEHLEATGHDLDENYICRTCGEMKNNVVDLDLVVADLVVVDGVYYTAEGHAVVIAVDAPIDYFNGNTLKSYVDLYGDMLFSMTYWEQLVGMMNEDGFVPLTEQTLVWFLDVITGNPNWEGDESHLPEYLGIQILRDQTHEHTYSASVTEPTCTEAGYTTYTCTTCGHSYVDDHVKAKNHNYVDGKCTECGASKVAQGDVNGDGKVDTTDAKLIMQYDLGIIDETALNLSVADVNDDGMIDTTDAKLIMQLDLGIITAFPNP